MAHDRYVVLSNKGRKYRVAEADTASNMARRFNRGQVVNVTTDLQMILGNMMDEPIPGPDTVLTIVELERNSEYASGWGARVEWHENGRVYTSRLWSLNWFIPVDAIDSGLAQAS